MELFTRLHLANQTSLDSHETCCQVGSDHRKGTALGLHSTIIDIGHSSGPLCLGLLLVLAGHHYIFAFTVASITLLIVPLLVFVGLHSWQSGDEAK